MQKLSNTHADTCFYNTIKKYGGTTHFSYINLMAKYIPEVENQGLVSSLLQNAETIPNE